MTPAAISEETIRHRLTFGTLSNYGGKLVGLAIAFLITPFVLHRLGAARYGLWGLIASLAGYSSLLDLGIGVTVVKYIAEHRARQEASEARSVLATAFCLYLGLAALGILASLAIAAVAIPILPLAAADRQEALWLMVLMGSCAALSLPCSVPTAALRGIQRFGAVNALNASGALLNAGATVAALLLGGGVRSLAAVNLAVMLIMQVPGCWVLWRAAPELRFTWADVRRDRLRPIFSFSSWIFAGNFADLFQSRSGEVVIGSFLLLPALAPYVLAKKLSETGQSLTGQFVRVLPPLAAELQALGDQARVQKLWMTSTRLTLALFTPIACILGFLSGTVLRLWAGPEYASGATALVLLTAAALVETTLWPAASVLQAVSRHRVLGIAALISGTAVATLSVLLVRPFGINGVALAVLLGSAAECAGFILPFTARILKLRMGEVLSTAVWPVLLPAAGISAVLLAGRIFLAPLSFPRVAALAIAGVALYAMLYLRSSRTKMEQATVLQLAHAVRSAAGLVGRA